MRASRKSLNRGGTNEHFAPWARRGTGVSAIRHPQKFLMFEGQRFVEVEWPADGRYDIGYQLAHKTERLGIGPYMGLFELASRKKLRGDMNKHQHKE